MTLPTPNADKMGLRCNWYAMASSETTITEKVPIIRAAVIVGRATLLWRKRDFADHHPLHHVCLVHRVQGYVRGVVCLDSSLILFDSMIAIPLSFSGHWWQFILAIVHTSLQDQEIYSTNGHSIELPKKKRMKETRNKSNKDS